MSYAKACHSLVCSGTKQLDASAFDIKDGEGPSIRVRVDCHEGPPVPIPNTEVKLMYADNTWRVTAREDR